MNIRNKTRYVFSALGAAVLACAMIPSAAQSPKTKATEAPSGYDNQTNGAITQAEFDHAMENFSEVEGPSDGLGPTFNNTSCVGCHLSGGAVGGSSQVTVLRAGHYEQASSSTLTAFRRDQNEQSRPSRSGQTFVPATVQMGDGSSVTARSLINQRSLCTDAQEHLGPQENVVAQRISLSTLGDGFVEAVPDATFMALAASQADSSHGTIQGEVVQVPVLEANGVTVVGRFGAKNQHGSLLSFAADAYLNEMGVTTPLLPDEVTTLCQPSDVNSPNSTMDDITNFASFMRATKAPSRGPITASVSTGLSVFRTLGCNTCHVESLQTAPAGTQMLGGQYTVPEALGNKIFHPFSDYLLHDVGTGDSIVQNGGDDTANKLRTMPLWGLRSRTELMHDGASTSYDAAIQRHQGEATNSTKSYTQLSSQQKQALWAFLGSL
jgi:CxxC motif-containing protein (DUF1111 family)